MDNQIIAVMNGTTVLFISNEAASGYFQRVLESSKQKKLLEDNTALGISSLNAVLENREGFAQRNIQKKPSTNDLRNLRAALCEGLRRLGVSLSDRTHRATREFEGMEDNRKMEIIRQWMKSLC